MADLRSLGNGKSNGEGCGSRSGFLRCATHDEAVSRFGRNDDSFGERRKTATATVKSCNCNGKTKCGGLSTASAKNADSGRDDDSLGRRGRENNDNDNGKSKSNGKSWLGKGVHSHPSQKREGWGTRTLLAPWRKTTATAVATMTAVRDWVSFSGVGWVVSDLGLAASHLSRGMVKANSSCFLSTEWIILM